MKRGDGRLTTRTPMADKSTAPSAELPPLPEPAIVSYQMDSAMRTQILHTYTADQMHSHAASAVAAALQAQPAVPAPVAFSDRFAAVFSALAGEQPPLVADAVRLAAAHAFQEWSAATPTAPAALAGMKVIVDPTLPDDVLELRSGQQVVRAMDTLRNAVLGGPGSAGDKKAREAQARATERMFAEWRAAPAPAPGHCLHEAVHGECECAPEAKAGCVSWVAAPVPAASDAYDLGDSPEIVAFDKGQRAAREGVQEVWAGFGDTPFEGCPESWGEKPFCRIAWYYDRGDPSVGEPAISGWSLTTDQTGTVVGDLAPVADDAAQIESALLAVHLIALEYDGCGLPVHSSEAIVRMAAAVRATHAAPVPVLPAGDALALLSELVEDVSIGPGERLRYFDWERYAEHKPDCLPPRGDQGCRCGLNSVRGNLDALLSACEGYEGRAPVDKARAALSRAGQADSEQPLGADSTGGANG
jgi:hypothetical protein